MAVQIVAVGRDDIPVFTMPDRFRHEVAYFMTPAGEAGAPQQLGRGEYWIRLAETAKWLDEGVLRIVSPLDSGTQAEIELSEEQELLLEWLTQHGIEHIRLQ